VRRLTLFLLLLVILAVAGGAGFAYYVARHVDSPLTGEPVAPNVAKQRAIAVMIDNISPDARPQSGLAQASMVYETLTEGGITRFMAVFLDHEASKIGPVRSTRLYYNSWAAGLGVIFGHDGGNVDALHQLPDLTSIANVDADVHPKPFYRTTDRLAPHNEYTSTAALRSFASSLGESTTGAPPALPFKSDAPTGQRPTPFTLSVDFSTPEYNVAWQYDPGTNTYLRSMGGRPHVDAVTGQQLAAKNVVVMRTVESAAYDPYTPGAIHLQTEGTGAVTVYRDGISVTGTWDKPSVDAPLRWLDTAGNPIPLDRGVTWVEIVPEGASVTPS
jgi:hypothetical protein